MRAFLFSFFLLFSIPVFCQPVEAYFQSAYKLQQKGKHQEALTQIDKALLTDSLNIDYLAMKGDILQSLKQYDAAYLLYSKGIAGAPKDTYLYNQRGLLHNSLGQFDKAIADFSTALGFASIDSVKNLLLVNRAAAAINSRQFTKAYDDLIVVYKRDSSNIGMLNNLAAVSDEVGRGDETLKYLLRIVKLQPDFYPAYGNIGFKYQEMGDHKKAIGYFNKVLSYKADDPLAFSNRGYNKLQTGDLKGAYADIEKAIQLYPANSYAYRNRALIYIKDNKTTEACKDLAKAIELGFTTMYGEEVKGLQKKYCK
jgi:tetratricopeptide (TPR) repeat protein